MFKQSRFYFSLFLILFAACSSKVLKTANEQDVRITEEFTDKVTIKEIEPEVKDSEPKASQVTEFKAPTTARSQPQIQAQPGRPRKRIKDQVIPVAPPRRPPQIEGTVGFAPGERRPLVDPFRVGEKVTFKVHYFKVTAGEMTLEVSPYVEVNGRKSYRFITTLKSDGMFSRFFFAEDRAETLVDFDTLIPSVFSLHVKHSNEIKEAKAYFDPRSLEANYWEKKATEKGGVQEKRQQWKMEPYAQNVFSAAFYMRVFQYEVGEEQAFYVADDEKNVIFRGKALRRETIKTALGPMKTIVVKPQIEARGVFKPVGDIYFWLTDDERKFIVRIEAEIKVGTIISEVVQIEPGRP